MYFNYLYFNYFTTLVKGYSRASKVTWIDPLPMNLWLPINVP